MRKAQAALEFLLTYGWAILVVLVAIGAFAYYFGLGGVVSPSKCTVEQPFTCTEYKVFSPVGGNSTVLLGIVANKGISSANVTLLCSSNGSVNSSVVAVGPTLSSRRLNATVIAFDCPIESSLFRGKIEIDYVLSGESVNHVARGSIVSSAN